MIMCDPGRWYAAPALYRWGGGGRVGTISNSQQQIDQNIVS